MIASADADLVRRPVQHTKESLMIREVLALLLAATALAGCNTIQGAGAAIERGGEEIQDAAGKAKR